MISKIRWTSLNLFSQFPELKGDAKDQVRNTYKCFNQDPVHFRKQNSKTKCPIRLNVTSIGKRNNPRLIQDKNTVINREIDRIRETIRVLEPDSRTAPSIVDFFRSS